MKPKKGISYSAKKTTIQKKKSPYWMRKNVKEDAEQFNKGFTRFKLKKSKEKRSDKNVL